MQRLAVALAAAIVSFAARANDSRAELPAGGLVFRLSESVEMRSEELFISRAEVRVRYEFFNSSNKDVTTIVAFPMPEVTVSDADVNISVPTENQENLLDFRTTVDGVPVRAQVEQRIFARGLDRTALLRKLGIPLAPHLAATNAALDRLSRDQREELIKVGLAQISEYDDTGHGMQTHLGARWSLKTTYYWEQTFPAQRTLIIEHRYKPSVNSSAESRLGAHRAVNQAEDQEFLRKYCVELGLQLQFDKEVKRAKPDHRIYFSEERIAYVLTTGANWSGPIKNFRLIVDKGQPDTLVSFCGDGVKKIDRTQFELRKLDYKPSSDLFVLFLNKKSVD